MNNTRRSERGVALLMVIILSGVALAIMTTLIYLVLVGTQTSGMQKRYRTALDAGIAGTDVLVQVIGLQGKPDQIAASFSGINLSSPVTSACSGTSVISGASYSTIQAKVMVSSTNWIGCDNTLKTDSSHYDLKFSLGTSPTYNVYAKIVDTVEGNTAGGAANTGGNVLVTTGVVSNTGGEVVVRAVPYLYTMEVDVENAIASSAERAKLQVLYQY